jgi:hypothetical protein
VFNSGVHNGGVRSFSSIPVTNGFMSALTLDIPNSKIVGTITKMKRGAAVAVINIDAPQAHSKSVPPGPALSGTYNSGFSVPTAPGTLQADEYPHGEGYAVVTVASADGVAKVVGSLADGTAFTSSAVINRDGTIPLYASFASRVGAICGTLDVETTPAADVAGTGIRWFRAANNGQYYPGGYAGGLTVDLAGTKFSTPATSLITNLAFVAGDSVDFSGGPFATPLNVVLATASTAATGPAFTSADKLTKISFVNATGLITGEHKTSMTAVKHVIRGILTGKDGTARAYGYILSPQPTHTDGSGQGGLVEID